MLDFNQRKKKFMEAVHGLCGDVDVFVLTLPREEIRNY